ncbi:MAG TPA: peroxiredoxin [Azospirillaceae bacterium]|nr:peroxiredoxin [Azospirillaceae bacterium]
MAVEIGSPAPDFTLPTDSGGSVTLSALRGKTVIVYFYPKDDTPGCTKEACGFRDAFPDFSASGAVVIGISKDQPVTHDKFKAKYDLPFTLATAPDTAFFEEWGVWVEKTMYGKTSMGLSRSTFLIDEEGIVRQAWRKVKVDGHVDKVLAAVKG